MSAATLDITSRAYAQALDSEDPLADYRNEFLITDPGKCYLDGNSLGRLPKRTIENVNEYLLNEWGDKLVDGWSSWIDEAQSTGDLIGRPVFAVFKLQARPSSVCDACRRPLP